MNYYYITGTSRGLGKALAEYLLAKAPNNVVIGISRNCSIEHKNYTHYSVDLTNPEQVAAFHFPPHHDAKRISLVNNAGVIGMIKPSGKMTSESILRAISVNLTAPTLLINTFLEAYRQVTAEKIVLNVSSGAGKNPVGGWSAYCATKAGLDMLCRVISFSYSVGSSWNSRHRHAG
jgi:benzil reductase ((S)-benzoin forming)